MLNPATNPPKDGFNCFTRELKKSLKAGKRVMVELRDGTYVEVIWWVGTGSDKGMQGFRAETTTRYFVWKNDGTSITSDDYDIMGDVDFS